MKIAVSQRIFRTISTTLCLVELYVAIFGLLPAYGRTHGLSFVGILQGEKCAGKLIRFVAIERKGLCCHSTQHKSFLFMI